jgi:HEAT repeat protein
MALVRIDDPSATRSITAALQHGDRQVRLATIDALLAAKDRRAVPLLACALGDLRPFGRNFPVAMQILAALRRSSDDQAAAAVAHAMRASTWLHVRQMLNVKRTAVGVLASMACPSAAAELAAAARQGDYFVRRYTRSLNRAGA